MKDVAALGIWGAMLGGYAATGYAARGYVAQRKDSRDSVR